MATYRVGVDIGGTFTDIVFMDADGRILVKKISSSVDNYARAISEGLLEMFRDTGLTGEAVEEVRHGTTVASNAILELKGAKTGLITTAGFRDVLEIRTLRMPRLYDIAWEKPTPLVDRYLRQVVDERMDVNGQVLRPLDKASAERAVDALLKEDVEAIAICLIHAYANPAHELAVKEIVRKKAPNLPCCISFEVLPEIKEYERTSTTVINTYIMPIVATYIASMKGDLGRIGVGAQLLLMQSNGGLTTAEAAERLPCHIIESGPAAGVVGAQALAERIGLKDVVSFDMGGTTAKASLIEDGQVTRSAEYQVGSGIMIGSRLMTGNGYSLKVPAIDLAEVGAGGGSIVWIDAGGALQVGPRSAGAKPGPLCYDQGGTEPTITDANMVLGYINPDYLCGGEVKLRSDIATRVFQSQVADPLKVELAQAAYGAHQVAASNMIRAIKAVSSERGRDPRSYSLFAFGGNGPLFAAGMATALGMKHVVLPPSPGLFSAFGLLYADVEHHYSRTFRRLTREADLTELNGTWDRMAQEALAQLASEGFVGARARIVRSAQMHYQGQIYELTIPVPAGRLDRAALAALDEAFGQEHERTYGHRAGPEEPVEIVNIQVVGQGVADRPRVPETVTVKRRGTSVTPKPRKAYFGSGHGWLDTPILIDRAELKAARQGPLIIEEYDATAIVPPGATASLDRYGNVLIDLS